MIRLDCSVYDIYMPKHAQGPVSPHTIVTLPNTNGMQLLLCYDNEGVYVNTYGKVSAGVTMCPGPDAGMERVCSEGLVSCRHSTGRGPGQGHFITRQMRRIVTSFSVSDQLRITIIFYRNVQFENVLNIGCWLAAVSACGDPHDLCYLHDTAQGGPWPGRPG